MKRVYLGLFAAALASAGYSQSAIKTNALPMRDDHRIVTQKGVASPNQQKGAVIGSVYDFSTPSNWTATLNTTTGGSISSNGWWIPTDPTLIPYSGLRPFASATASNGYAFINSDSAGNANSQNADITLATPVDMSTQPYVTLEFYQNYRTYQDVRTVQVSPDNGTTWVDFPITDGSETGINVAETRSINITSVAGGASQVLVRFHYEGTYGWYWAVDDVAFRVTDPNDLQLTQAMYGSLGPWGATLPYGQVPTNHIQPVDISAIASNVGYADQTNTVLSATATGGGDNFSGTSATGFTCLSGANADTLTLTTQYTPSTTLGTRTISYDITSDFTDATPTDNMGQAAFDITTYIYARDMGVASGGSYNQGLAFEDGNIFDIVVADTLYSVNVTISTSTQGAPVIYGKLYSIDATSGNFVEEASTPDYNVDMTNDPGTEVTLPFYNTSGTTHKPILAAGTSYLLVVGAYGDGGNSNDLVISTSGSSEPQTSFYYDIAGTGPSGPNTWYYTTSTTMVRMNFDPSSNTLGIEENTINLGLEQNMPNPANGNTLINYTVENTTDINFQVVDMTGKIVYTSYEGTRTPGTYTIKFNTDDLSSGMYFYSISNGTSKVTKSMSVAK